MTGLLAALQDRIFVGEEALRRGLPLASAFVYVADS